MLPSLGEGFCGHFVFVRQSETRHHLSVPRNGEWKQMSVIIAFDPFAFSDLNDGVATSRAQGR